jgi:hypothetical protein
MSSALSLKNSIISVKDYGIFRTSILSSQNLFTKDEILIKLRNEIIAIYS